MSFVERRENSQLQPVILLEPSTSALVADGAIERRWSFRTGLKRVPLGREETGRVSPCPHHQVTAQVCPLGVCELAEHGSKLLMVLLQGSGRGGSVMNSEGMFARERSCQSWRLPENPTILDDVQRNGSTLDTRLRYVILKGLGNILRL